MKRLFLIGVMGLACLLAAGTVMAQDAAAPLDGNFTDALSLEEKPAAKPLDPALLAIPENASPAELFAFIDGLEEKLPQPTTQEEMEQLINALTDVYLKVADQVLAHADATKEDKDKANQQKMVALMAKSRTDEKAAADLDAFLDEMIANAEDDAAKSQAYQMKIQALMSNAQMDPSAIEKVAALADDILAKEKGEELQMLGLEVKAQTFLARLQQDPTAADAMLTFLDPMISSEETAQAVREKAQEIKAVALLIAAEQDAEKEPAFEAYFDELLNGPLSPESRQRLYQLRIQTLMPQQPQPMQQGQAPEEDPAVAEAKAKKLDALVDRLMKEDSEELKSLGYAAKASNLLAAVKKDPAAVDTLFAYADEVLANNPSDKVKEQMAGLKIQGYMMKMQQGEAVEADMIAFIDQMLSENPAEQFKGRLASIKVQLLSMAVQKDPAQADTLAEALTSLADVPGLENLLPIGWANVYMAKINAVAEQKGSIDDLNAVLAQMKEKLAAMPMLAVMLSDMQQALETIGENNGDPELMAKVFGEFAELCNASDNEILKEAGKALQGVLDLKKMVGTDIAFEGKEVAPEQDKTFNSADLAGKYYLVDLWTTADRGCFEAIEEMKDLYTDFQPKNFEIVGINTDENTEMLSRVLEVFEMPWIVLSKKLSADAGLAFPEVFNAVTPGTRILVGPDGKTVMVADDLAKVRAFLTEKLGEPEKKAEEAAPETEK